MAAKSSDSRRPDLAAMLAPLLRELVAAEEPVLQAHGLTMWGYVVLLALDRSSMRTQAALAAAIGADVRHTANRRIRRGSGVDPPGGLDGRGRRARGIPHRVSGA